MAKQAFTLREAIRALRKHHGRLEGPPTADPFELMLWENVAYLASPERRRAAFELLQSTVGTAPHEILAARKSPLERVRGLGILKRDFAARNAYQGQAMNPRS